ncbi:hypothetical protein ACVWXS_001183 [Lysinibacillus sp. TE18511]
MKRFVAKYKSTKRCICCNKSINSGEVYYRERKVFNEVVEGTGIVSWNLYYCARCNYKIQRKKERFAKFVTSDKCKHPKSHTVWGLIFGEDYAQEPKYDECEICGKTF